MNLDVLLNFYKNDKRCLEIAKEITLSKPQHLHLKGLQGSTLAFILNAVYSNNLASQTNHILIFQDAESAAYFHNSFENITSALDVFYFPSSFKNKNNYQLLNSSHVMLRTEALTRLASGGNKKIIITYPEAIFEKVVLSKTLTENIISIKQADVLDVNAVLESFVQQGFLRTDFVYEPGQFAIRGGILDIYSFGNEKPYRIELFGNEVDSIRIFDPQTQLSEKKLLQVSIIPNLEKLKEEVSSATEKVSLFDFLPEQTLVWMDDWNFIKEKIQQQEEDLSIYLNYVQSPEMVATSSDESIELNMKAVVQLDDFSPAANIEKDLLKKHVLEFSEKATFPFAKKNISSKTFQFNIKEQPAFNRQFSLLIKNLQDFEKEGYALFIFAENPKQLERLHSIFYRLKCRIANNAFGFCY